MKSNLIEIEAREVHSTEMAWLLDVGQDKPIRFPKPAVEFDGETLTLTLPEPLALEKGAI